MVTELKLDPIPGTRSDTKYDAHLAPCTCKSFGCFVECCGVRAMVTGVSVVTKSLLWMFPVAHNLTTRRSTLWTVMQADLYQSGVRRLTNIYYFG